MQLRKIEEIYITLQFSANINGCSTFDAGNTRRRHHSVSYYQIFLLPDLPVQMKTSFGLLLTDLSFQMKTSFGLLLPDLPAGADPNLQLGGPNYIMTVSPQTPQYSPKRQNPP